MNDDTETLAEVRDAGLTADEQDALVKELFAEDDSCVHNLMGMFDLIDGILAARIEQARAGEGALRHECGTGSLCDGWPFGVDDAYRTIAAVSWPAERKENRDGWAVTMRHRADLFEQEASRARERLEAAITHGRAALTDTAGDDREHDHGDWLAARIEQARAGEGALRERVEAVLFLACHHCGRLPDQDGDHSCPCPTPDSECLQHTLHPVAPLDMIRAALTDTAGDDRGEPAEWAEWIEHCTQHVGCEWDETTALSIAKALRGPKPFGIAKGDAR